jgi:hypothetical protein
MEKNNYKQFPLLLPQEKLEEIKKEAKENNLSVTGLIRLKLFSKKIMGVAQ